MKNYIITLFAIALVFSAGCARIDEVEMASSNISINVQNVTPQDEKTTKCVMESVKISEDLYISAIEEDWEMPSSETTEDTKGTIVTDETFYSTHKTNGFKVNAYKHDDATLFINNIQFKPDLGMGWQPAPAVSWPDYASDFYAYAPYNAVTYTSASKTFTHTVSTTNTSQVDLLVAKRENVPAKYDNALSLYFDHALCAVKFVTNEKIINAKLTQIEIRNLYTKGTYDCVDGSWNTLSTAATIKAGSLAVNTTEGVADTPLTAENQTFFLIPQVSGENAEIALSFTVSGTTSSTTNTTSKTVIIPIKNFEFKKGKIVTFRIGTSIDYTFDLADATQSVLVFKNTSSASTKTTVNVTSTKSIPQIGDNLLQDWKFKSYTVDGVTTDVSGTTFSVNGLTVTKSGQNFTVLAAARSGFNPGTNAYWNGGNGDYSPADWTDATSAIPIDLSKYDYSKEQASDTYSDATAHGAFTAVRNTANCYIIRHAGTYMIPLVYGNAIKNGQENEQSYYPGIEGEAPRLDRFVNHKGAGIMDPYIENNDNCSASTASVVWQETSGMISGVSIEGSSQEKGDYDADNVRYLKFTILSSKICQSNAIIAIKDAGGSVIWSWHIWTTNDPELLSDDIVLFNRSSVKYDVFPLNCLGWVDSNIYPGKGDVTVELEQVTSGNTISVSISQPHVNSQSNGVYYQFGRKDPMPRANTLTGFTKTQCGATGEKSLSDGIKNPGVLYYFPNDNTEWSTPTYYNLWTGKLCDTNNLYEQGGDIIKTIYDPSPVGYMIPASNAFSAFSDSDSIRHHGNPNIEGDYNFGWYFITNNNNQTVFFASAGYRDHKDGTVKDTGVGGLYWTANVVAGNGFHLAFNKDSATPAWSDKRSRCFSVRPVKE